MYHIILCRRYNVFEYFAPSELLSPETCDAETYTDSEYTYCFKTINHGELFASFVLAIKYLTSRSGIEYEEVIRTNFIVKDVL